MPFFFLVCVIIVVILILFFILVTFVYIFQWSGIKCPFLPARSFF